MPLKFYIRACAQTLLNSKSQEVKAELKQGFCPHVCQGCLLKIPVLKGE